MKVGNTDGNPLQQPKKEALQMDKCYIYLRVSTEAQVDEELWAASQDILGSRKHINRRKFNSEHEHILSGIIKCPICGRGLTGMVRKRNNKKGGIVENYYYRCSHGRIDEEGNRCTYRPSWNEDKFNHEVEQFLLNLINDRVYNDFIVARLSEETDVASLEEDRSRLQEQLRQALGARDKLLSMMEKLNETDRHYDKKISDMRDRLDVIYDKMTDIEEAIKDISGKIEKGHSDRLNARQMYRLLSDYGKLYNKMTKLEKKEFFSRFIERIDLYPDEKDVTKCIRSIKLMFPVEYKADTRDNRLLQENTVETVVLLSREKVNGHINIDLDVEKLESKGGTATYAEIKDYIEEKYGYKVSSLYIGQIKDKVGIKERKNYNTGSGKSKVPSCPLEKEEAIMDAFRHFNLI